MRGGGGRFFVSLVVAALLGSCGGEEITTCSTDVDCGVGALCKHRLCVADPAPEIVLTADRREARIGEAVVVDAGASSAAAGMEFRVEPDGAASLEIEGRRAVIRRQVPHQGVDVVVTARSASGAVAEGRLHVAARNSEPTVQLVATPDPFQPGAEVLLEAQATDGDGDPLSFEWDLEGGAGSLAGAGNRATLSTVAGTEAIRYAVRVRALDGKGGASEASVTLEARNAAPAIVLPEVLVDHQCGGDPFTCSASASLAVEVEDVGPTSVAFRLLSDRTDVAHRFVEDEDGITTLELVCAPACAIAGTWQVEVTATDALGAATTRQLAVEVRNRPPMLRAHDGSAVPHSALADEGGVRYLLARAAGSVITWEDPDGDPPAPGSVRWSSTSEIVEFEDPASLDTLVRAIGTREELLAIELAVVAADINGAEAADRAAIPVGNTGPSATFGGDPREGHSYLRTEADGSRVYRKAISLESLEASDPDGDPLAVTVELDPLDPEAVGRVVRLVEEEGGYLLEGIGPDFLERSYRVIVRVSDGWGGSASSTGSVLVSNRAPEVITRPVTASVATGRSCQTFSCCIPHYSGVGCLAEPDARVATRWGSTNGPLTFSDAVTVRDPDGDPVVLEVGFGYEHLSEAQVRDGTTWRGTATLACTPLGGDWRCPLEVRLQGRADHLGFYCTLDTGTAVGATAAVAARASDGLGGRSTEARWTWGGSDDPSDGSCP